MRCRIVRGAAEVGGSCVELEHDGQRLVLDLGRPLTAAMDEDVALPHISGLRTRDPSLLGIVVSHGHPDHYGLATSITADVPIYLGEATQRLLREALFFSPAGAYLRSAAHLHHQVPIELGPFTVTPLIADHSAFDAYSLIVDAGGRRLLYSGDVRAHGRKRSFEELVERPPANVDVLLLEGTRVGDDGARSALSEQELEQKFVDLIDETPGLLLAAYSPQNIDRLVTLYRAARRSRRLLVMDLYAATMARATMRDTIPQADWDGIRVYVPQSQRVKVKQSGQFDRIAAVRANRIYGEDLAASPREFVLTFRGSMAAELERAGCLRDAAVAWSMWRGYLDQPSSARLRDWLARNDLPLHHLHSSGHASVADLKRLAEAVGGRVVPIHTNAPERFADLFARVERRRDGEWWNV